MHFASGTPAHVLDELSKFQNADGGFGHGIESDIRMPHSSPFLSTLAFQILRELDVPSSNPLVQKGIEYYEQTFDRSIEGWDPNGKKVDDHPHAVWWSYSPIETRLDPLVQANPGAEIVGYLNRYGDLASRELGDVATRIVFEAFDSLPEDMEYHA
jgi:hypothetical protein